MSDKTKIEWTDATWNPVTGCTKVSTGCDHCYAETIATRFAGTSAYPNGFQVTLRPERLDQPIRWKRPRRIFVNSMSDLFHADVPDDYIAQVFAVMAIASRHTFQVLTKRHGRMKALLNSRDFYATVRGHLRNTYGFSEVDAFGTDLFPLLNAWLGVSVEDQAAADLRIPLLLDTPAAVRFLSCEPLLGPVDLRDHVDKLSDDDLGTCDWGHCNRAAIAVRRDFSHEDLGYVSMLPVCAAHRGIDWVIVGGESGPGARPMHPEWARSLRDQCVAAGVPFHFKQRGEWTWNEPGAFRMPTLPLSDRVAVMHPAGMTAMTRTNPFDPFERGHPHWATRIERVGKKAAGRELDGRTWDEYPVRYE